MSDNWPYVSKDRWTIEVYKFRLREVEALRANAEEIAHLHKTERDRLRKAGRAVVEATTQWDEDEAIMRLGRELEKQRRPAVPAPLHPDPAPGEHREFGSATAPCPLCGSWEWPHQCVDTPAGVGG